MKSSTSTSHHHHHIFDHLFMRRSNHPHLLHTSFPSSLPSKLVISLFLILSPLLPSSDCGYVEQQQQQHGGGGGYSSPGGGGYQPGGYQDVVVKKYVNPYLPAPPGETPDCANNNGHGATSPGTTYCEKIDTYPREVISYLLYKWGRTYSQFIKSESDRDFVPKIPIVYGPAPHPPLPYDSYFPPKYDNDNGGYLPPPPSSSGNGNFSNGEKYVDSYFRKREPTGYDYSYSIPPPQQNGGYNPNNNNNHMAAAAAAAIVASPPVMHSLWWNHRDTRSGRQAYPHMAPYNNQHNWGQQARYRRRVKRQDADNVQKLCPTSQREIIPRAAMNNEGNWMYVVNMGESQSQYQQRVISETCIRPGGQCDNICNVPPGFSATCRQKYVQKRLVALDESGAGLSNVVFWFPHCCECEIRG